MIEIRKNIFETNSSSTHSLVIVSKDDWKKFKNNELVLNLYAGELNPVNESLPKQTSDGKWEYQGKVYDDIYDIESKEFCVWDRSQTFYDAMCEMSVEKIEKDLGDGRIAVSIYAYDD